MLSNLNPLSNDILKELKGNFLMAIGRALQLEFLGINHGQDG